MQPRQALLDVWAAVVRASWRPSGEWVTGGRFSSNSISDAEQLLCLLMPAVRIPDFSLDEPDRTGDQMLAKLRPLGSASEIPRVLVDILIDYHERYTVNDEPIFSGGSYFEANGEEPTVEQRDLDIVDSFAIAVTLSLATLGFVKVYRKTTKRTDIRRKAKDLEAMASRRLSAAMVGLLRSFSVSAFPTDSDLGNELLRTINQGNMPPRQVIGDLQKELRPTTAIFREILIGSGTRKAEQLDSPDMLYECGWSWGIVPEAEVIETTEPVGTQRVGIAEDAPYLYFTVVAMDAISDLFSERTRGLGLLNEEQQRLSRALEIRADVTRAYWVTVATFRSGDRWPLEDIPWRTTDGLHSDYFTLQVTSLAVQGLVNTRGTDADLIRIGNVLGELSNRARITRRPVDNDSAAQIHGIGVQVPLVNSDLAGNSTLVWNVPEFAPLLLQRLIGIAGMLSDPRQRSVILESADRVWDHLEARRLPHDAPTGGNLWDRPEAIFPSLNPTEKDQPSWYFTERVVQALIVTANLLSRPPIRSEGLVRNAVDLLIEAEQLFDNERMRGTGEGGPTLRDQVKEIEVTLRRSREGLAERPGTAAALASNALLMLDELIAGRQNASGVA
jgi:hypothetical protein